MAYTNYILNDTIRSVEQRIAATDDAELKVFLEGTLSCLTDAKNELEELTYENDDMQGAIDKLEEEVDDLNSDVNRLEDKVDDLESEVADLEEELAEFDK